MFVCLYLLLSCNFVIEETKKEKWFHIKIYSQVWYSKDCWFKIKSSNARTSFFFCLTFCCWTISWRVVSGNVFTLICSSFQTFHLTTRVSFSNRMRLGNPLIKQCFLCRFLRTTIIAIIYYNGKIRCSRSENE